MAVRYTECFAPDKRGPSINTSINIFIFDAVETLTPPWFLLHHSNTSSSDVYATKSLAFRIQLSNVTDYKIQNFDAYYLAITRPLAKIAKISVLLKLLRLRYIPKICTYHLATNNLLN